MVVRDNRRYIFSFCNLYCCLQQLSTLVLLPLLVLVPAALSQDFTELDWDAESRQLQVRSLIMFDIVHVVKE